MQLPRLTYEEEEARRATRRGQTDQARRTSSACPQRPAPRPGSTPSPAVSPKPTLTLSRPPAAERSIRGGAATLAQLARRGGHRGSRKAGRLPRQRAPHAGARAADTGTSRRGGGGARCSCVWLLVSRRRSCAPRSYRSAVTRAGGQEALRSPPACRWCCARTACPGSRRPAHRGGGSPPGWRVRKGRLPRRSARCAQPCVPR